jgi:hypothetical protein
VGSSEIGGNDKKDKRKDPKTKEEAGVLGLKDSVLGLKDGRVGPKTKEEAGVLGLKDSVLGLKDSRVGPKTKDQADISTVRDVESVLIGLVYKESAESRKDLEEVMGPRNKEEKEVVKSKEEVKEVVKSKEEGVQSRVRNHLKVRVHSWIDNCQGS